MEEFAIKKFLIKKFWNPKIKKKSIYFLSNKCNRNCDFCYFNYKNYLNPSNKSIDNLKKYNPDLVYFSGGEPFENIKLFDLFFSLNFNNLERIIIFSNGDKLNWEIIYKLTDYAKQIDLIINNGFKIFSSQHKKVKVYNKIFINNSYINLIPKLHNEDVILSFTFPSKIGKEFKINKPFFDKIEEFLKNYKGRIFLFEPTSFYEKSSSWFNEKDLYDDYIYYPFEKKIKKQINVCNNCKNFGKYDNCLKEIDKNLCKRIKRKCFYCKYNNICLVPQSRFDFIDVDKINCDEFLYPLFEMYIKYRDVFNGLQRIN